MKAEIKKSQEIFNFGFRTNEVIDMIDKINPQVFNNMVDKLKKDCPIITNVLKQFVVTEKTSTNKIKTASTKMKASVLLLSLLLGVRDSKKWK